MGHGAGMLILAGLVAVAGLVVVGWSWAGLATVDPEIVDRSDGVEVVLPRQHRQRYAAGVLLLAVAVALVGVTVARDPGSPYGGWVTVSVCALLFGAHAASVLSRGTGRLVLTRDGLVSRPALGRSRRMAWSDVHGVAADRRRVLVVDGDGREVWVPEITGWGAERTERLLEDLARGGVGERLTATVLRSWADRT